MNNESLALEWLSRYLGRAITIDEVGYESNVFDYEELDEMLMPEKDFAIFRSYEQLLTLVYIYDTILVYIIQSIEQETSKLKLIGLMDGYSLIRSQLIKGDEKPCSTSY